MLREAKRPKVIHFRYSEELPGVMMPSWLIRRLGLTFRPTGGMTQVLNDNVVGVAWCMDTDNFNKKVGRTIALARAGV